MTPYTPPLKIGKNLLKGGGICTRIVLINVPYHLIRLFQDAQSALWQSKQIGQFSPSINMVPHWPHVRRHQTVCTWIESPGPVAFICCIYFEIFWFSTWKISAVRWINLYSRCPTVKQLRAFWKTLQQSLEMKFNHQKKDLLHETGL